MIFYHRTLLDIAIVNIRIGQTYYHPDLLISHMPLLTKQIRIPYVTSLNLRFISTAWSQISNINIDPRTCLHANINESPRSEEQEGEAIHSLFWSSVHCNSFLHIIQTPYTILSLESFQHLLSLLDRLLLFSISKGSFVLFAHSISTIL